MAKFGFRVNKLRISGENLPPAEITFKQGLNVITGLSDTGKSYIVQCLDFMLGAQTPPKKLEESRNYTEIFLEIKDSHGAVYTLQRGLDGGPFLKYDGRIDDIESLTPLKLSPKHSAKNDANISSFILSLCGIGAVQVRKNARNETVNLSFRTISHWFLVNEISIIGEISPILSPVVYQTTTLKSAFNFLLTGKDDANLIAAPDTAAQQQTRQAILRDVYSKLISDLKKQIESKEESHTSISHRISQLESKIAEVSSAIAASSAILQERQSIREQAWIAQQEADSRLIVISELIKRFDLLRQHYFSDLARLEFTTEGKHFFEQLEPVNCPLCGAPLEEHESKTMCIVKRGELIDFEEAAIEEAKKIRSQMLDLESTIGTLETERLQVTEISDTNRVTVQESDSYISQVLRPQVFARRDELDQLQSAYKTLAELEANVALLQELEKAMAALDSSNETDVVERTYTSLDRSALRKFCDIIEAILADWKYPDIGVVEFDERQMDIIIGGRQRRSNGKGYRALTHASFVIGLMQYCKNQSLPHPNFVVLDSPLTTFKEHEGSSSEEVSGEVQAAFFEMLAVNTVDEQIIIMENKEPTASSKSKMHFIEFTGKGGPNRRGFFPVLE